MGEAPGNTAGELRSLIMLPPPEDEGSARGDNTSAGDQHTGRDTCAGEETVESSATKHPPSLVPFSPSLLGMTETGASEGRKISPTTVTVVSRSIFLSFSWRCPDLPRGNDWGTNLRHSSLPMLSVEGSAGREHLRRLRRRCFEVSAFLVMSRLIRQSTWPST